jgi:hypothetical protein
VKSLFETSSAIELRKRIRSLRSDSERQWRAKDFAAEQQRLIDWIDRFSAGGPERCTTHPHCFFGQMTPLEWATLGYKHLDHHLRQFKRLKQRKTWLAPMPRKAMAQAGGRDDVRTLLM